VKSLYLIHIDRTKDFSEEELLQEARETFSGEVKVPQDLEWVEIP